jgi:Chaperone of endosialidase
MKTNIPAVLITLTLLCLGLLPKSQAVSPAPDGGYPGGNTAEGQNALLSLTSGTYNTAVGLFSLESNSTANFNTGIGAGTLLVNTADQNTATGAGALLISTTGEQNTANGAFALFSNTEGSFHTAVGHQALFSNTTGNGNTAIGGGALFNNITGGLNTALGVGAGVGVTTASNVICIGAGGNNVDNSCFIGNIFGATSSGGTAVFINSNGRLGTATSSQRFKDHIKPMENASEALFALKPVCFRYKKEIDPVGISQLGLVAEDVVKVNPDLVVRDTEGKPYTVRYDQVNAMLLNEFLKEHSTVQELKKEIATLTATVKEQAAQIQKVSAQLAAASPSRGGLEASRTAPQIVNNP